MKRKTTTKRRTARRRTTAKRKPKAKRAMKKGVAKGRYQFSITAAKRKQLNTSARNLVKMVDGLEKWVYQVLHILEEI